MIDSQQRIHPVHEAGDEESTAPHDGRKHMYSASSSDSVSLAGISSQQETAQIAKTMPILTSILLIAYVVTTILGFISLESPEDAIGDPYFTIMEILILTIMPPMVLTMVLFQRLICAKTSPFFGQVSVIFMALCAGVTSCVHATVLAVSRDFYQESENVNAQVIHEYLFSFQWPSVVYALDILAWDWFFGLSMLFGAVAIAWKGGTKMERALRVLMCISGILSVVGLIAVPLDNMNVRIIGIVGYAFFGIGVFIAMAVTF